MAWDKSLCQIDFGTTYPNRIHGICIEVGCLLTVVGDMPSTECPSSLYSLMFTSAFLVIKRIALILTHSPRTES